MVRAYQITSQSLGFPPGLVPDQHFSRSAYITKTCLGNLEIYSAVKLKFSLEKKIDFLSIVAQNVDCGHTLEPPRRDGSNEYQQSIFSTKHKKNRYTLQGLNVV